MLETGQGGKTSAERERKMGVGRISRMIRYLGWDFLPARLSRVLVKLDLQGNPQTGPEGASAARLKFG